MVDSLRAVGAVTSGSWPVEAEQSVIGGMARLLNPGVHAAFALLLPSGCRPVG